MSVVSVDVCQVEFCSSGDQSPIELLPCVLCLRVTEETRREGLDTLGMSSQ